MGVTAIVRKDEIRQGGFQVFKLVFHRGTGIRHEAVPKLSQGEAANRATSEYTGPLPGFSRTIVNGTEHDPMDRGVGELLEQAQNRAATPDLDIIGVRSQTKNVQRARRIHWQR